ncbi:DUF1851 domain-containing protein (plasmid) [Aliiroseovarius crassostreae]|uniref:DUF1851 domain-containing protein n=1 Tax=Aliiroseovarius crassostreae TaxID=154981 RepID=UPI0022098F78|nr:DUF1851 domain-containing protein [Aliiroseovarius crassostreae]UWQ03522.1 DUF1851 domain-containing protein [Aliiroseovarius crassostreae]
MDNPPKNMGGIEQKYAIASFDALFAKYSGCSFNKGLYQLLPKEKIPEFTASIVAAFPEFSKRTIIFGSDWMGRAFGIDGARRKDDQPLILMFDLSDRRALEVPEDFVGFHNNELVDYPNDSLAKEFFHDYLAAGGKHPEAGQVCGLDVPAFLGGQETFENMHLIDLDVYWHVTGQLISTASV